MREVVMLLVKKNVMEGVEVFVSILEFVKVTKSNVCWAKRVVLKLA